MRNLQKSSRLQNVPEMGGGALQPRDIQQKVHYVLMDQ